MVDEATLQEGFEGQAKAMREFGYPSVTAEMIREHHKAWMAGDPQPDVIYKFSESAFNDYPSIFGRSPYGRRD